MCKVWRARASKHLTKFGDKKNHSDRTATVWTLQSCISLHAASLDCIGNLHAFLLADADQPFELSTAKILPNNDKFSTGNRKANPGHISKQKHIDVFFWFFWRTDLKINVSCKGSIDFHHVSQNAMPATEFAPRWPRNLHLVTTSRSADNAIRKNTRLKFCACHAKWNRRCPKCCAWHENCNASSDSDPKVLRLPHRTIFDAFASTKNATHLLKETLKYCACHTEFRRVCKNVIMSGSATPATQLLRKTALQPVWNLQKADVYRSCPHRHCDGTTEASGPRRHMLEHQNEHFVRDFLTFYSSQLQNQRFPTSLTWTDRNIDVSCEASVYFHHMSQNALPPRNLHIVATSRSADNAIRKEHATRHVQSAARATQNDIGGVQSAAPAGKNARHVLRVPHKTTFDTLWNTLECHKVPRLPREMKLEKAAKRNILQNFP